MLQDSLETEENGKKKLIQNTCIIQVGFAKNVDQVVSGGKGWIKDIWKDILLILVNRFISGEKGARQL